MYTDLKTGRNFLYAMCIFWLFFAIAATFLPVILGLFQTDIGLSARTDYSDHVWMHGGLDIFSVAAIAFFLARGDVITANMLRGMAVAAAMPTIAIIVSLTTTQYWAPYFGLAGIGTFTFVVWGFVIARQYP